MIIGLVLALYNANVTTDWIRVANAAADIPIRAIVPVPNVSPPDPGWAPVYPSLEKYQQGIESLQAAGVEVYAYTHLRNLSKPCCTCCGNLTQYKEWVDIIHSTANFNGIMMDNNDAPWSAPNENQNGLIAMYKPAASYIKSLGFGVWANGPHISKTGSINANVSQWKEYLEYSSFTTLFEMSVDDWLKYPSATADLSTRLDWPASELGGYVLDIPNDPTNASIAIEKSLRLAVKRGLKWLYPTIKCQHRTGSCTYADLPTYWDQMVSIIKKINDENVLTS